MIITRSLLDSASASTAIDIQLGSCVTEIGQGAFSGYTNITDVEFPDALTIIGASAFYRSSVTSVEIPSGVTSIRNDAFNNCSGLTSCTFEENSQLSTIGSYAFSGCTSLSSIEIPNSVTSIGECAFFHCSGLNRVDVKPTTPPTLELNVFYGTTCLIYVKEESYNSYINSWSSYADRIVYEGIQPKVTYVTADGSITFYKCDGNQTANKGIVPSNVTSTTIGDCVTSINDFSSSSYGNIVLPSNVTTIKDSAFWDATATSVSFSEGLEYIGRYAFGRFVCPSLIVLPTTMKTIQMYAFQKSTISGILINGSNIIGYAAFSGSSLQYAEIDNVDTIDGFQECSGLTSVTIGNNVTTIGAGAFDGCSGLTNVTIGNNVTDIWQYAFSGCTSLTSINIPNSVTSIDKGAFGGCSSLTTCTIGSGVTTIGTSAFTNCSSLIGINIPNSVTSINNAVFSGCSSLTSVTIGNGVTSIGASAFTNCSGLTSVIIPSGVTSIGEYAFFNCRNLERIVVNRTIPPTLANTTAFGNIYNFTIYVPSDSYELYINAQYWSSYASRIQPIPNS